MAILMHNMDEYPARGSLVLGKKTEEGPPQGHQSGGGSAVLRDDFWCHQFPTPKTEDGEAEGCREAPIPQGTT